jgi:hypothetical protein
MTEETLEEAAQRYTEEHKWEEQDPWLDFIAGAKWQQEKMYSEEEVKQIIDATLIAHSDFVLADVPEWFKQFKKK